MLPRDHTYKYLTCMRLTCYTHDYTTYMLSSWGGKTLSPHRHSGCSLGPLHASSHTSPRIYTRILTCRPFWPCPDTFLSTVCLSLSLHPHAAPWTPHCISPLHPHPLSTPFPPSPLCRSSIRDKAVDVLLSLVSSTALTAPLLLETLRPALRNRNIKLRQQIALFLRRLIDAPTYTGTCLHHLMHAPTSIGWPLLHLCPPLGTDSGGLSVSSPLYTRLSPATQLTRPFPNYQTPPLCSRVAEPAQPADGVPVGAGVGREWGGAGRGYGGPGSPHGQARTTRRHQTPRGARYVSTDDPWMIEGQGGLEAWRAVMLPFPLRLCLERFMGPLGSPPFMLLRPFMLTPSLTPLALFPPGVRRAQIRLLTAACNQGGQNECSNGPAGRPDRTGRLPGSRATGETAEKTLGQSSSSTHSAPGAQMAQVRKAGKNEKEGT